MIGVCRRSFKKRQRLFLFVVL